MFRVFFVEDEEKTRRRITNYLLRELPDAEVVVAGSVREAEGKLNEIKDTGPPLDAAILDSHLPRQTTYVIDTTLCPLISRQFPSSFVVHCTRYAENPELAKHIRNAHTTAAGPRGCVVPKVEGWEDHLIREIAGYRVKTQLESFLGLGIAPGPSVSRQTGGTAQLGRLMADIRRLWRWLSADTKELVLDHFDVDDSRGEVRVTVGGRL